MKGGDYIWAEVQNQLKQLHQAQGKAQHHQDVQAARGQLAGINLQHHINRLPGQIRKVHQLIGGNLLDLPLAVMLQSKERQAG